jgi:hypothetical protein
VSLYVTTAPTATPGDDTDDVVTSLFSRPSSLRERRSLQPVDRLSRDLGDVCTTACDPLEIAAILEAQGVTDAASRDYYNCDDVFDLAERLWARTPTVVEQVADQVVDDDRPGSLRDLLHGVIFALNGLFFSVGLQAASEPKVIGSLVGALVLSWALGQAASLLWFRLEARKGDQAGRTVLRRALQLVLAAGLAAGWGLDRAGLPPSITLMAVAQVYLVIAASALLLYRKELWFFLSLVPAVGCAVASWLAPGWADPTVLLAVVVASVVVIVAEAAWLVRPTGEGPHRAALQWADVSSALQMALYGVTGAVMLSHSAMSTLVTGVHHDIKGFDVSVLPLVLTIGVAEWQLRGYRQLSRQVLGLTDDLERFGTVAWRFLLRSFGRYVGVLGLVTVALWAAVRLTDGAVPAESTLLSLAYAVLGGALFLNLVLIAHARVDLALRSMIAAATLYGVELVVQRSVHLDPPVLAAAYLALCLGLLSSLLLATRAVVRQALVHL